MIPGIESQMRGWSVSDGDRVDPVAHALRRLYLRVELCPCMTANCVQCQGDKALIEDAWIASNPKA